MNTRIYRVTDGDDIRLVEAANPAQAIRFCAAQRFSVRAAKPLDVAELMGRGVKVEYATEAEEDA